MVCLRRTAIVMYLTGVVAAIPGLYSSCVVGVPIRRSRRCDQLYQAHPDLRAQLSYGYLLWRTNEHLLLIGQRINTDYGHLDLLHCQCEVTS